MESQWSYELVGYTDSNYTGNFENWKSIMGYCFFINWTVVSWWNTKQRTISTFNTKAKYIVLSYLIQENIWNRHFLKKLKIAKSINACILNGNNKTSIILTKNAKSQACTKHIDVQHHYIWELITDTKFKVKYICNANILAYGFTKALIIDNF